jgi:hypothetical protein
VPDRTWPGACILGTKPDDIGIPEVLDLKLDCGHLERLEEVLKHDLRWKY